MEGLVVTDGVAGADDVGEAGYRGLKQAEQEQAAGFRMLLTHRGRPTRTDGSIASSDLSLDLAAVVASSELALDIQVDGELGDAAPELPADLLRELEPLSPPSDPGRGEESAGARGEGAASVQWDAR